MNKRFKQSETIVARAARRLLESLGEPGARGACSDVENDMIVVLAPRNGVTVVRASVPARACEYAQSQGLVRWEGGPQAAQLQLTEEGRAYLRRKSAAPGADEFRAQHSELATRAIEKGAPPVLFNEGESPIAWLARRRGRDGTAFLAPPLVEAGERFRRDVTQAQILQRVTANWEASIASSRRDADGGVHVSEIGIDARRRLSRAVDAVGPDLAGLLMDVCGYLKGLETVESERAWPPRSGKVVLKIALQRLAGHYGLANEARGPNASGQTLHWGEPDYRPRIEPVEIEAWTKPSQSP
jgi:hypothetical protein